MKTMRMLLAVVLLAAAFGIHADKPEKPPKGQGKYLIVLWEPGTPVPGKKDERMKRIAEPDVDKLGGRLLSKQANRRVVFLPYAAAKQLRKHQAVSFVQRIWMGEPLSEWNETSANMRSIRTDDVSTNDDPTFTWDKSYGYDAAGNITTIGSDTFAYDDLDRLTQASIDGASQSYSYDAYGNLTTIVTGGSSKSIPTDPSSNRMIGQTYDAAGNLTSRNGQGTYVYDSLNMLVEYGAPGNISKRRILYDADDERIVALGGLTGPHRWTIRGLDGQILREFTSWEMSPYSEMVWEQDHIRGEGQLIAGETIEFHYLPDPTPTSDFMWGGKRHYHLDHLGSVRVVTNDDGNAISENDLFPFGTARTKQYQEQINWGNPHTDGMRFAGHWRDFMGHPEVESDDYLDYMHARYYDPHLGRFLSVDPGRDWDPAQPQSWNMYAYTRNNPINRTDPNGRQSIARICQYRPCGVIATPIDEEARQDSAAAAEAVKALQPGTSTEEKVIGGSILTAIIVKHVAPFLIPGESAATQSVKATVQANKAAGDAFRDAVATELRAAGRQVTTEVVKKTPFGPRVIDIEVADDTGRVLGGVEAKAGNSPYKASQRAKDTWLKLFQHYTVNLIRLKY